MKTLNLVLLAVTGGALGVVAIDAVKSAANAAIKKNTPILGPNGVEGDLTPGPRARGAQPSDFTVSSPTHLIPPDPNKTLNDILVSADPEVFLMLNPKLAESLATVRAFIAKYGPSNGLVSAHVNTNPVSIVVTTKAPIDDVKQFFPAMMTSEGFPVILVRV